MEVRRDAEARWQRDESGEDLVDFHFSADYETAKKGSDVDADPEWVGRRRGRRGGDGAEDANISAEVEQEVFPEDIDDTVGEET